MSKVAVEHLPVDGASQLRRTPPAVLLSYNIPQILRTTPVGGRGLEKARELIDIADREIAVVAERKRPRLREIADQDTDPVRECLEQRDRKTFERGRQNEQAAIREELAERLALLKSCEDDAPIGRAAA